MREYACCFSGHRKIDRLRIPGLRERLVSEILRFTRDGVFRFHCGGALGFDTLAAEAVLKAREEEGSVRLILVLPCEEQTQRWPREDVERYNYIRSRADGIIYTSRDYYPGCMQARNRHMVDRSAHLICYLTRSSGGTAYTVSYAFERGLSILNLASPNKRSGT